MLKFTLVACVLISCQILCAQPDDYYSYYKGEIRLTDEADKQYDSARFSVYWYDGPSGQENLRRTEIKRSPYGNNLILFDGKTFEHTLLYELIRYTGTKKDTMLFHVPVGITQFGEKGDLGTIPFIPGEFVFVKNITSPYYGPDSLKNLNFYIGKVRTPREQNNSRAHFIFKEYSRQINRTLNYEGSLDSMQKKTGTWKGYREDGTIWITDQYLNDKLHGERVYYDEEGQIDAIIRYIKGRSEEDHRQDSVKQRHADSLNAVIKPTSPSSEPEKPHQPIQPQPQKAPPVTYEPVAKHRTSFTVQNREFKTIDGAVLIINGEKAKQIPGGYPYIIDSLGGPPYHIIIRHSSYLAEEYRGFSQLRGELYLRRKGEDYFYEFSYKEPYLRMRRYLLVSMKPVEGTRKLLDSLLQPLQMEIALVYADHERSYSAPKGSSPVSRHSYLYIVKRKDGKEFTPVSTELAALRGSREVDFAGPPLFRFDIPSVPMSFYPRLSIRMHHTVDTSEGKEIIAGLGFGSPVVQLGHYVLHLDPAIGMAVNEILDKLQKIEKVISVEVPFWGRTQEETE